MPYVPGPEDLALHGMRVLGFPATPRTTSRYGPGTGTAAELLPDHEARGWARSLGFTGSSGWSLTHTGRSENERRPAAEPSQPGVQDIAVDAHQRFLPLSQRSGTACTHWQIRPARGKPMAFNEHTD